MKKLFVISILVLAALAQAQNGGGPGGAGRQGMRGNQNSMTGLLNRPDVQKELKLTDEQKTKLQELNPGRGGRGAGGAGAGGGNAGGGAGRGGAGGGGNAGGGGAAGGAGRGAGGGNFDPAQMQQRMAEREKATLAVLSADQQKRLKELYVQRAGNRVLLREDFQKELGLTDAQKGKITDLQTKQREAQQDLMEKMRNQEIDRTEMRDKMTSFEKIMNDELGKVLTADQAAKLKAMAGATFKFDEDNGGN